MPDRLSPSLTTPDARTSRALAFRGGALRTTTLSLLFAFGLSTAPAWSAVPPGFTDQLVATVASPTAIDFTPDGRLLVASQGGTLTVVPPGGAPTVALTIPAASICTNSERGLLGVAVSPAFASNQNIFLYYTRNASGTCVNRVSRFTLPASNIVSMAGEVVLLDNMPSTAGNHNGGDVEFGKDGFLYVSIGDGGCDYAGDSGCAGANDASRDQHELTGKILRITEAGGIPASNPFQGAGTARCNATGGTTPGNQCQETFAWGLRNPFRIAADPNAVGTRIFINDVGQGLWEEIDDAAAGTDYGWNCREGRHTNSTTGPCNPTPAGMVDPIFEYAHNTTIPGTTSPASCNCISGGAFVPNGLWSGYDGKYLFGDCTCGGIFNVDPAGALTTAADFASGLGTVVHLRFGPPGSPRALYYTTLASGGQVRRIIGPQSYFSLSPCRLLDTRNPTGTFGGPALTNGVTRSFPAVGSCGIPPGATAIAVNVTSTAASTAGFLNLFATGTTAPNVSTLNFNAGQTRANNAVVQLGTGDAFSVACAMGAGSTQVVVDVVGYFQ